jgi:hypothetical protein
MEDELNTFSVAAGFSLFWPFRSASFESLQLTLASTG